MGSLSHRHNKTAMERYFSEFVPMLEDEIRHEDLDDDPTVDLDCLQVARPEPARSHQQQSSKQQQQKRRASEPVRKSVPPNTTFEMAVKNGSCSLDGLRDITEHLKRGSLYGDKLIRIMLDGLEKSMSPEIFTIFVQQGVPSTWLPIVKRNNDDTPYIEFLIKNDKSDEEPFSQIADYSLEHLALSKYVLDQMLASTRRSNQQNQPPEVWTTPPDRTIMSNSQFAAFQKKQQQQQQHQQQQQALLRQQQLKQQQQQQSRQQQEQLAKKRLAAIDKNKRSSLPAMTTSTPIRQRQAAASKRASAIPVSDIHAADPLNDSKRILPPRACKASGDSKLYVQ